MARPLKNNADYFSHDAGMRDDPRIKALRRKFKLEGYAVYCMFLEIISDADNFELRLNFDIIAGDFDLDPERLKDIMQYCVTLDLFQFDVDNLILRCKTLEKRFEGMLSKRKRDRKGVIAVDNTQSKVKESKLKDIIIPHVPFEVFETKQQAHKEITDNYHDIEKARSILSNRGWVSATDNDVGALLFHFLETNDDATEKPKSEVRQHFKNWINKFDLNELTKLSISISTRFRQRQQA